MSTSVIEPGARFAGRYRLEERIKDSGGSSLWKAIDEILARAVAVRTFEPGFPRVHEVVTAARAASRLTDPRLTQVFDADDSGERAYVVSEWVVGETLEQMLAKAPLEPGRATTLLYEAAEALSAAHAAGLAHLCLSPRDLVWTTGGTVKVLGVATDAVLADHYSDSPASVDTRGLGSMLYAALTAHWPGEPSRSSLPAAPTAGASASGSGSQSGAHENATTVTTPDGDPKANVTTPDEPASASLLAPRLVQAGVPSAVDDIVCRSLGLPAPASGPDAEALRTPSDFAGALRRVPRTPLPLFAGLGTAPTPRPPAPTRATAAYHQPPAQAQPTQVHSAQPAPAPARSAAPPRPRRSSSGPSTTPPPVQPTTPVGRPSHHGAPRKPMNRGLLGIAAAALTVVVGLSAWALSSGNDHGDKSGKQGNVGHTGQTNSPSEPAATALKPSGVSSIEDSKGDTDSQIGKNLDTLMKGGHGRPWQSAGYHGDNFGNLKNGLGVVFDMGRKVKVDSVRVNTAGVGNAPIELRVGDAKDLGALHVVGKGTSQGATFPIKAEKAASGQYVCIWFTTPVPDRFKAKLSEVTILGSAG
ncbi:protein kinase family protein [Actinomadura rupiterrae]|uniref:protein kinase family protein n=1 Tax=Actinomadura rupiterrae TaxID=559627 RepID=UPI0020A3D213|nr:protein kinase family protein [Actinomadura rupiterrae]MCP2340548.1 serine/threonine protein kinase [Actinomadura rupiterrae]